VNWESRRLAVIGCGHVGLVTAAFLAEQGHVVAGIDVDARRVRALNSGRVPFWEPQLAELTASNLASGRLSFTTSFEDGLAGCSAVFLCVDTPGTQTGAADLSRIRAAAGEVARVLASHAATPLIVNKSTSPIGTAETIETIVSRAFAASGVRPPHIIANPEFLREGHAVEDMFSPSRIVLGASDPRDAEAIGQLYAGTPATVMIVGLRAAEMIKYVSNSFLATRVSFVNEVARLCENLEIDSDAVLAGAALDPRIGSAFFQPGIGYGGSCLPKDVAALAHTGESSGVAMRVLSAVQQANVAQRKHAVNCIRRLVGGLDGKTIAAWGITFKGGTEDVRESPALDVLALLRNDGASIRLYDPSLCDGRATRTVADHWCRTALDAADGADAVVVLSDWEEFRSVDLEAVRQRMRGTALFDGRNLLERDTVEAAGLQYWGIGRPLRRALPEVVEAAG
jgi:UDPglucose 6-dehydrogenase